MNQVESNPAPPDRFSCILKGFRPHRASEVLDAASQAEAILADAEVRAAKVLAGAESRIAMAAEEARVLAAEAAETDAAETVARAVGWARAYRGELEEQLTHAVLAVAERIWGQLGVERPAAAARIAGELRDELASRGRLRVRVHPSDVEAISSLEGVDAVADPSLFSGDCVAEVGEEIYDARASVRAELALDALAAALGHCRMEGGSNAR